MTSFFKYANLKFEMNMNIENFEKFLTSVNNDIEKIFDNQKEYIHCQNGCSLCCEKGDYPISEIEYEYMMIAYNELKRETKELIKQNVKEIKNTDSYKCPFLINNSCSIYTHRPFVCRTFGVLTEDAKGNPSFPFCATMNKNYSKIYDKETNHLSSKLVEQNGYKIFPKFFRLSNKVIMNIPLAKQLNIIFGETKKMIDFLELK